MRQVTERMAVLIQVVWAVTIQIRMGGKLIAVLIIFFCVLEQTTRPVFSAIIAVIQATIDKILAITMKTGQLLLAIFLITTLAQIQCPTTFLQGIAALLRTRRQQIPILETRRQQIPILETRRQQIPILETIFSLTIALPIIIPQPTISITMPVMQTHRTHRAHPTISSAMEVAIKETTPRQIMCFKTLQTTTINSQTTPTTILGMLTIKLIMFSNNIA